MFPNSLIPSTQTSVLAEVQVNTLAGIKQYFAHISDFSLSSWLSDKGYNLNKLLDYSNLMSDLGLSRYLLQTECSASLLISNSSTGYFIYVV